METAEGHVLYDGLDPRWNARAEALNARLEADGLPVRIANLGTIWTVCYLRPGRYHWMLQYYLRAEGLALSWVGTGRFIFSGAYTEDDSAAVAARFVVAARAMAAAGWGSGPEDAGRNALGRRLVREVIRHKFR